jgi:hypothetical protein
LPELRLFDRFSAKRLPRRMMRRRAMRMMWRGADAEGSAKQEPPYAHVHALKTQVDADRFLKSPSVAAFKTYISWQRSAAQGRLMPPKC